MTMPNDNWPLFATTSSSGYTISSTLNTIHMPQPVALTALEWLDAEVERTCKLARP